MTHFNYLEAFAVVACFINIFLAARAHALNFLFGAIAVSLYFVIFYHAKLYALMSLQLVFLALQFYGAYQWISGAADISAVPIKKHPLIYFMLGCGASFILFALIAYVLSFTDSTTIYMDALVTALSLSAQWMMSRKWIINWWFWMIVDILSVKIYLYKGLYFTSFLYAVLFFICVYGYVNWKKSTSPHKVS